MTRPILTDQDGKELIGVTLTRALVRLPDSPRRKRNRVLWVLFWIAFGIVVFAIGCGLLIVLNVTGGV